MGNPDLSDYFKPYAESATTEDISHEDTTPVILPAADIYRRMPFGIREIEFAVDCDTTMAQQIFSYLQSMAKEYGYDPEQVFQACCVSASNKNQKISNYFTEILKKTSL